MYWAYVLFSDTAKRFYCGHSDDVPRRVRQHNDPDHTCTKTTKRWAGPWKLIWQSSPLETRGEAMVLERRIKKRGIRRFLEDQDRSPAGNEIV